MTEASPRSRRGWWGPVLAVYWLICFTATHLPQAALPPVSFGDKTEHFIAYGLLAGLMYLWIIHRFPKARPAWLIVLLVAMAYGAVDELTQPIVTRYADWRDWIADSIGAALGLAVAMIAVWLFRRKS